MIVDIIRRRPVPQPQKGKPVLFKRRKPDDGNVMSLSSLRRAFDFIRMLDAVGYPPAFLETKGLRFEFKDARLLGKKVIAHVTITQSK